ncbi:hypothetical protein K474DRAFT_395481 [Panus rudis PR-1116 ss-1]|nr:hypothetical protein K474DRAFT_395481 [Panus rudis PR-1116 ss-1]
MSFIELTRNSYQSGLTSKKWVKLCRLLSSKLQDEYHPPPTLQQAMAHSVLALLHDHPGDSALRDYLKTAIQEGELPLYVFLAVFFESIQTMAIQDADTLHMLCRVVLECHYASGKLPEESILSNNYAGAEPANLIQGALTLTRFANTAAISPFHHLHTSSSELLILVLSSVRDYTQIAPSQVIAIFNSATNVLSDLHLPTDVRQVLETLVLHLMQVSNDGRLSHDTHTLQSQRLGSNGDISVPAPETDIASCGLVLQSLVIRRANEFGSGDTSHAVAQLVALYRWTTWSPSIFYRQLLLAAATIVAQARNDQSLLYRAFVTGRLPRLVSAFERFMISDGGAGEAEWRNAMHHAITFLAQRDQILQKCDQNHHELLNSDSGSPSAPSPTFLCELLDQLLEAGLVEHSFVATKFPSHPNEVHSRLRSAAQDAGVELESYLESKLLPESDLDDNLKQIRKITRDPCSHFSFSELIRKRFMNQGSSLDIEHLSHYCRLLNAYPSALDVICLQARLTDILAVAIAIIEDYDCDTVGDPQSAVRQFGEIVLFVQVALARYPLKAEKFVLGDRRLTADIFERANVPYRIEDLREPEPHAFKLWYKALFDKNSEGIDDNILRSTRPKTFLRIAGTLFSNAIRMCAMGKLDKDVLHNGVSFFTGYTGTLLNWTLGGVIKVLLRELQQRRPEGHLHTCEVLQMLLLSPTCPPVILHLSAGSILRSLPKGLIPMSNTETFDTTPLRHAALQSLGMPPEGQYTVFSNRTSLTQGYFSISDPPALPNAAELNPDWLHTPINTLRTALDEVDAGKVPWVDIDRSCLIMPPTKFLFTLFIELAPLRQIEALRRISTFILTAPRSPRSPPLLPIFLHVTLPALLQWFDSAATDQSLAAELLVSTIYSAMTAALHLEWALQNVCSEERSPLGEPTSSMARRLGGDLRRQGSNSPVGSMILKRLTSSQSFITNFPTFVS